MTASRTHSRRALPTAAGLLAALAAVAACSGPVDTPSSSAAHAGATADSAMVVTEELQLSDAAVGNVAGHAAIAAPAAPPPPPVAASPASARLSKTAGRAERAMQPTPAPQLPGAALATAEPSVAPSMVIRTGHAVLEVDSMEAATARVHAAAQRLGGYVANTSVQGGRDETRSATLEVKVPAARFDELVRGLEPIGRVESVNVNAQDVGEEFVDLQARVTNSRRLEERLVVLLATRTGRLEDVLNVERELARVREEIERHEGRLRYLRTRAAVSTLTVTVHEPSPIVTRVQGASPIAEALRQAWRNFVSLVAVTIAASGVLVPLALVAGGAWLWWRRRRRSFAPARVVPMTE